MSSYWGEEKYLIANAMDITVSIVSHGHGTLVAQLLRDLDRLDSMRGVRVILTLNIPEDAPASEYSNLQLDIVRNSQARGFAANHNAAFRRCVTEWFAVLNPDLRIPLGHDPFQTLLAVEDRKGELGLVVPVVINSRGGVEDSVRSNLTPWSLLIRRLKTASRAKYQQKNSFCWYAGMCMVFRASALRSVQGFDERYFLYCEDYDICARLHLAGYRLTQVAGSSVVHDAQRDSHRSFKHLSWHLASLIRVWTSKPFWRVSGLPFGIPRS